MNGTSLTWIAGCATAWLAAAPSLAAQQPVERRADSLAAELRALKARLDSLVGVLGRRDTAPADELGALRAAAARAAGRDTARPDTAAARRPVGGARNLSLLNPEISVTGDLHGVVEPEGAQRDNFALQEVEFSFQSALDPYSHTKIFAAIEDGEVDIEEGYFYYTGLPGRLRVDLGVFRQQLGELNRWHRHALPEWEYPLVLTRYAGEEGLIGTGVSLYWVSPTGGAVGTHELWAQVTRGTNDSLYADDGRPAVLLHLNNFWQLSDATYFQVGGTYSSGRHAGTVNGRSELHGVDARFTWRPPRRSLYREWTARGEWYASTRRLAPGDATAHGWFVGTTYRLGRRWIAGARYDRVEAAGGALAADRQVMGTLTYWQSEWIYLRAQWLRARDAAGVTSNRIGLQAVWSIGPHKHEQY